MKQGTEIALPSLHLHQQMLMMRPFSSKITKDYLSGQKDLSTPENLRLIGNCTRASTDLGFQVLRQNRKKADSVLGEGASEAIIKDIALNEIVYPDLFKATGSIDWNSIKAHLQDSFPELSADEILLPVQAGYYQSKKNWPEFNKVVLNYIKAGNISNSQLNSFAWAVFNHCGDKAMIQAALSWSKKSLSGNDKRNPMFLDTYANLLYKTGKKREALKWEEAALKLSNNDPDIEANLNKMKAKEKTWEKE